MIKEIEADCPAATFCKGDIVMAITIVFPSRAHTAYEIAANTFADLAKQVAHEDAQLIIDDDYLHSAGSGELTVLIGNDAVNAVTAQMYLSGQTGSFGIRYGTDDYCIRSVVCNGNRFLILAGGRPRAALYAVYRYFERFCGCRYFWDGDRIPQCALPDSGIDLTESPRFDYRGLRYFAHRGLHRFQAEHWSFEDWATEIDWMLKKRLNLFLLRIGMDDVFQKAFPDIVPYPALDADISCVQASSQGYDDRSSFWSLEYRGHLRKKILQYAFARDLMHPEDCGTVSHWYSRTPVDFLQKVQPSLLPQSNQSYSDPTGRVWDIRDKENFDHYFKLTEAHIQAYGKPELFHTIGLGERLYSKDHKENQRMKLFVYHKIASTLKQRYPNAPLLIASWDLWMHFTPEEVRELIADLDPGQAMILDYTSDTVRSNNFTQWGILNRFPWIFGIFSGYAPDTELLGNYEWTNRRLQIAKDDPMCRGLILWPELSHGDPFTIEYFARNAWEETTQPIAQQVDQYCKDRYPESIHAEMASIWHSALPIIALQSWSMTDTCAMVGRDLFPRISLPSTTFHIFVKEKAVEYRKKVASFAAQADAAVTVLEKLSGLAVKDELSRRDMYDLARTVIGRYINGAIYLAQLLYATGAPLSALENAMASAEDLLAMLGEVLGSHEDYSLSATLDRLRQVTETNPNFEKTLKTNAECSYCRSYMYEHVKYLYLPEMKCVFDEVKRAVRTNGTYHRESIAPTLSDIRTRYFRTPLSNMQGDTLRFSEAVRKAADAVGRIDFKGQAL